MPEPPMTPSTALVMARNSPKPETKRPQAFD
jgi:hypothetical protein